MNAWVKCALKTLLCAVLTAAVTCLVGQSASYADGTGTSDPGVVPTVIAADAAGPDVRTYAASAATALYRALRSARAAEGATHHATSPGLTYLPRIRSLPTSLRAALVPSTLRAAPGRSRFDADGRIGFWTGSRATAACLNLRTGDVTAAPCSTRKPAAATPRTLRTAYRHMVRSIVWFDQHAEVTRLRAGDVALAVQIAAAEYPGWAYVGYRDTDGDGTVDARTLELVHPVSHECAEMLLPDHDPQGRTYTASLLPCP